DTCHRGCGTHSFVRNNWLGCIEFPFTSLLHHTKVYHYEDEQLLQTAYNFIRFCNALFPTRRVITMVSDMEGNGVLVTSYIKALNPPEELLNMFPGHIQSTCFIIARFVSLIPCLSDILEINEADDNVCDCWMTSEQCLNWTVASREEHAIILCNYFLYIGKRAWVILGTSVLEGSVAYVLSLEGVEYILWNPMNGQCYKQFDTFCPLQRIDCLIGEENVWFNLQTHNETMSVDVDVSKEMLWKPLFSKSFQPREFPTEQVAGYPIQLPYSSIQSVTEAVYQTGLHTTEIPNTEFCIAVYIHPYPNNILSVWIYLASLVRRH
ncbi:hypothetical protein FKM82_014382, partial [Ascaphus truei]